MTAGKCRECSTVSSANGGKSARNIGIDLADLHKMAPGAGDGTTFLVIHGNLTEGLTDFERKGGNLL